MKNLTRATLYDVICLTQPPMREFNYIGLFETDQSKPYQLMLYASPDMSFELETDEETKTCNLKCSIPCEYKDSACPVTFNIPRDTQNFTVKIHNS